MAASATICGTFDVTVLFDPDFGNASTGYTISNVDARGNAPGRAFRVQQVLLTGSGGAGLTVTVKQNSAAGDTVATVNNPGTGVVDQPVPLTEGNTSFTSGDDLFLDLVAGLNDTVEKVIIRCIASPAQTVTVA